MSRPKPPPVPVGSHAHHIGHRLEGARAALASFGHPATAPARPAGLPPARVQVAAIKRDLGSAF